MKKAEKDLEVLVVEDTPTHIATAQRELGGRVRLSIASTYKDAIRMLDGQRYDVVITDENIPFSGKPEYPLHDKTWTGKPVPIGAHVALYAAGKQVPFIAMASSNHHDNEVAACLDDFVQERTWILGSSRYYRGRWSSDDGKAYAYILEHMEEDME